MKKLLPFLLVIFMAGNIQAKVVNLAWDASPDAEVVGYKIYYDTTLSAALNGIGAAEGNAPVDVGAVLTGTLNGLEDAETHYIAVTAYNSSGDESVYSNVVTSEPVVVEPEPLPLLDLGIEWNIIP